MLEDRSNFLADDHDDCLQPEQYRDYNQDYDLQFVTPRRKHSVKPVPSFRPERQG